MFRSSTIIRELALNLAKVIFTLEYSVKLRRYLLWDCVAPCHGMACVVHKFNVSFNVFFKLIKMHLLVRELYIKTQLYEIMIYSATCFDPVGSSSG